MQGFGAFRFTFGAFRTVPNDQRSALGK